MAISIGHAVPQSLAQQHSAAHQLMAMGFAAGEVVELKDADSKQFFEIKSIDDTNVELVDPNRHITGCEEVKTISTQKAMLEKLMLKRSTFKKQEQITAIGVRSKQWDVDLAIDVARRAVRKAHDEFNYCNDLLSVYKHPDAVVNTSNSKIKKGGLTLVPSSNRFQARGDRCSGHLSFGNILGHEICLLRHVKNDTEDELWMAPYWYVPSRDDNGNMKLQTHDVVVDGRVVKVPVMVNTKEIKVGGHLVLLGLKRKRE